MSCVSEIRKTQKKTTMTQTCRFNEQPPTVNNGGYRKGRWTVWINLGARPVTSVGGEGADDAPMFEADTDRLVLTDNSVPGFLEAVDQLHLATATSGEVEAILRYFHAGDDIEAWRSLRKVQVRGYDKCGRVNRFCLDGRTMWLDSGMRRKIRSRLAAEEASGRDMTTLWDGTAPIQMPVESAQEMLDRLELYAIDCYDTTARHLAVIEKLPTIEELRAFDISVGYPDPLHFSIADEMD